MNLNKILLLVYLASLVSCKPAKNSYYLQNNGFMESTIHLKDTVYYCKSSILKRGDVVIFKAYDHGVKSNLKIALRVVGIPGDTIEIRNSNVYINAHNYLLPKTSLYHYSIPGNLDKSLSDSFANFHYFTDEKYLHLYLDQDDSSRFEKLFSNRLGHLKRGYYQYLNQSILLAGKNDRGWTQDNFGPVIIPQKNSTLPPDTINTFCNVKSTSKSENKVLCNYYFLLGDNFHDCIDSRFLGLIPDSLILGKRVDQ